MNNDKVGNFIKELRLEKGLTQKELADKLYITSMAVSKWERGLSCPDISLLDDLSKILDVSIIEILRGERVSDKEYTNNKDIIDSASYGEKVSFNKYYKFVRNCLISILCVILIVVVFKSGMLFYRRYHKVVLTENLCRDVANVNKKIDLILENQKSFSDEDYEVIKDYVDRIKYYVKGKSTSKYCDYKYINMLELNNYFSESFMYIANANLDNATDYSDLYTVLLKYDLSVSDYGKITSFINSVQGDFVHLSYNLRIMTNSFYDFSEDFYTYGSYFSLASSLDMSNLLEFVLDDIIKVGGYNEK